MIHEFLDAVIPRLKGALSIKTRLGWQTTADIERLIPVLNQYPLAELIVHPRTGVQRYGGEPDHGAFERCVKQVAHPVVYNGDIRTLENYKILAGRFDGVNRWMIGRGAIADPFLPMAIKTGKDDIDDRPAGIKRFHHALYERYSDILDGPSHVLNKLKGIWRYFSVPYADHKKELKKINKAHHPEQYLELVNRFFDARASDEKVSRHGPV